MNERHRKNAASLGCWVFWSSWATGVRLDRTEVQDFDVRKRIGHGGSSIARLSKALWLHSTEWKTMQNTNAALSHVCLNYKSLPTRHCYAVTTRGDLSDR